MLFFFFFLIQTRTPLRVGGAAVNDLVWCLQAHWGVGSQVRKQSLRQTETSEQICGPVGIGTLEESLEAPIISPVTFLRARVPPVFQNCSQHLLIAGSPS